MRTIEQLMEILPPLVKTVDLPKRGGSVTVRALSGADALKVSEQISTATKELPEGVVRATFIIAAQLAAYLSDDNGAPICTLDQGHILVSTWYQSDILAVVTAGNRLNLSSDEGIEEARKN